MNIIRLLINKAISSSSSSPDEKKIYRKILIEIILENIPKKNKSQITLKEIREKAQSIGITGIVPMDCDEYVE